MKHMTKKEFRELCSFHEYGRGRNKHNAIYFGWQSTELGTGFKYGVAASIEFMTKAELFNELYDWVVHEVEPQYCVRYKYAAQDHNRFKVPLTLNW